MFGETAQSHIFLFRFAPVWGLSVSVCGYWLVWVEKKPQNHSRCLLECLCLLSSCAGMGCFWGAERLFWRLPGVFSTQVGYAGGSTPNPNYHEVCSGKTCILLDVF